MLVLGIESSCDETAVAIVEDGAKVHAHSLITQIAKHKKWGGVIPEVASRMHLEVINPLITDALKDAGKDISDIDAVAVTQGPGLLGSLLVGVNAAKTLAWVHDKPLVRVNHLHGHICANYLYEKDAEPVELEPPFLCLLASGGHTQIIKVKSYTDIEIVGETIDDAAGEAFDKVARLLELPYPGGPHLDKLAQTAPEKRKYELPIANVKNFDFSFSGLKTAFLRLNKSISDDEWNDNKANIASSFQDCVARTFCKKVVKVLEQDPSFETVVLAGGVAANSAIRGMFKEKLERDYNLVFPSLRYCTDNAAMIASAAYFNYQEDSSTCKDFDFEPYPRV